MVLADCSSLFTCLDWVLLAMSSVIRLADRESATQFNPRRVASLPNQAADSQAMRRGFSKPALQEVDQWHG
jgi:hypothetical protein